MSVKAALASLSCLFCLGADAAIGAASETLSAQTPVLVASSTAKDLLLFYEEQDLVTATKRLTSLRKAPSIATIISADEIRNMGARDLLDVLKMVPGFGISINEFGSMMVEVRGIRTQASEKILVMIDGHSLNRNMNGSSLLYNVAGRLPIENIRQVEVIRGPGSALYGNSAFVATINIITRNPEEINGLEAKVGGGSFDSFKGNLVGGKAVGDKLTVSGSLDHYQTDGPRLTVEADALTGTPFSMAPGTPDLDHRQTDAFLKIGYGGLAFRGHYKTLKESFYIGLASALNDESYGEIETYWGELAYNLHPAKGISAVMKLHYDYYEQDAYMQLYPDGFLGIFPDGMISKAPGKTRTTGGELQVDWDAFKGNHLIVGISYEGLEQYDVRQLANFDPLTGAPNPAVQEVANWNQDASRRIWAAYLQDEWQLPYDANLTAGLRYDNYSDFGDTVNPRVGLVWSFLENVDLKLLYGQAFRAPNFQELYNINNPVVVGNSTLKPERIQTYEAGLAWRLSRSFATSLNYFDSLIKDQIGWDTSTTPAVNANIGKSETQGIELGLSGAIGGDVFWKAAYAWQDPRNAETDERLPYVPSQRASGSVNYAPIKYLNLHADMLWTGSRPRSEGDSRPDVPAYATVDLAVTLKNFYKTLEIQAAVFNLFDERHNDPDTSGGASNLIGTDAKVPGDFPREGISWFVTASYKF